MFIHLVLLMAFQLAGEAVSAGTGLSFPGPLFGLLLLFAFLQATGKPSEKLSDTGMVLIDHLGLLFVPAGAAIMSFGPLLLVDGKAIGVSLVISTALGIVVGGLIGGAPASRERHSPAPKEL